MKKKIIPLVVSAVLFIAGCITAIIGFVQNSGTAAIYPELDLFNITDDDVGKTFSGSVYTDIMYVETSQNGEFYFLWIYGSADDNADLMVIGFDAPKGVSDIFEYAQSTGEYSENKPFPFCGTVRKSNDVITEKISASISAYYDFLNQLYEDTEGIINEEAFRESYENISPYYIEATEAVNGDVFIWIGCAVVAAAVFVLLLTLFGRKFLIVFAVIVVLPVIILLISLTGKFRTMATVTEVADGLYSMTCHYDYKCDEFLNADISTIDEMIGWITKEHFFGLPIEFDAGNFGCSAFTAATPDGQRLFGRNFDYDETDTLVIYTEPKDGYASYGVTDLRFFDIGTENGLDGNSVAAKAFMLAAPYATMDGINEKGVGIGILQLDIDELHQDNGKTDLLIFAAIRGILDKCATVDEAIDLLDNYDIHSFLSHSYHLFITDSTGRSVIVEWTADKTYIVEDTACTNDVMSNNEFYDPEWKCRRYDTIKKWLAEKDDVLTADEAMAVTRDASKNNSSFSTQWSCVYNLDEFTLDICIDRNYETVHSFSRDDFR